MIPGQTFSINFYEDSEEFAFLRENLLTKECESIPIIMGPMILNSLVIVECSISTGELGRRIATVTFAPTVR